MNISRKVINPLSATMTALLLFPATLQATLLSGTVSNLSGTRNIPYTQPSSMTLRWSMLRSPAATEPGVTVTSPSGTFSDPSGTIVLGTVTKTLSKSLPLDAGSTFNITETVRIPRDVLFKAYKENIPTIYYRRDFTDCPGVRCNTLTPTLATSFSVSGSTAAAFGIADYALRFSDGGLAAIVQQNQTLTAEASLNVTGSGTLRGLWEVATPGSSAGTPFYQSLQLVTRQVSSGQTLQFLSPPLPTRVAGNHLLRFRLLDPGLSEAPPVLQYVVRQTQTPAAAPIPSVAPPQDASIDQNTRFEWLAVPGAVGYKLEVVGVMPTENAAAIQPETYWWHVEALDAQGRVIAASAWSRINIAK